MNYIRGRRMPRCCAAALAEVWSLLNDPVFPRLDPDLLERWRVYCEFEGFDTMGISAVLDDQFAISEFATAIAAAGNATLLFPSEQAWRRAPTRLYVRIVFGAERQELLDRQDRERQEREASCSTCGGDGMVNQDGGRVDPSVPGQECSPCPERCAAALKVAGELDDLQQLRTTMRPWPKAVSRGDEASREDSGSASNPPA